VKTSDFTSWGLLTNISSPQDKLSIPHTTTTFLATARKFTMTSHRNSATEAVAVTLRQRTFQTFIFTSELFTTNKMTMNPPILLSSASTITPITPKDRRSDTTDVIKAESQTALDPTSRMHLQSDKGWEPCIRAGGDEFGGDIGQ
jgi:hypothetical protein